MNNKFGIQNFRVFDDKGAQFKVAPITVLTGCNSSGKSSMIKAIMLFEDFFKRLKMDYKSGNLKDVLSYPLKLNEGEHKLGKFNNTLNDNSESDEMVFLFKRHSLFADSDIDIEFVFKGSENILGNGFLDKVRIKYDDKYIYAYSFSFPEEKDRLYIDHKSFIELYLNFLKKVSNSDEFTMDFNPNGSQFTDETLRYNPLYKGLSNVNVETKTLRNDLAYLYLKNSSEDKNEKLISYFKTLEGKNLTHYTLFDSPAYEYLKDATKENIGELIIDKIEDDEKAHNNIKMDKKNIVAQLEFIANLFTKSGHTYFKDYFAELENNYFSEKYASKIFSKDKLNGVIFGGKDNSVSMNFLSSTKNALTLYKVGPRGFNTRFSLNHLSNNKDFTSFEQFCVTMFGFSEFVSPGYYLEKDTTKDYEEFMLDGAYNYEEYMAVNDHEQWMEYVNYFLDDAFFNLPDYIDNVEFINSNRPKVERFYDLSNLSGSFAHLIKGYVSYDGREILINGKKKYIPGDFLRKWVKELEIADDVMFESTKEGSGIFIYLLKDDMQILLADLGYGITQVLSMLLKIELCILSNFEKVEKGSILGEMINPFEYENKEQTISIEEPEANLHPKLQSRLANMFMEASELYNIKFILETHSEYLIRKFQYLVAADELDTEKVIVYYLNEPDAQKRPKDTPHVVELSINEDGSLDGEFGSGFFDEATNWKFELMRLKNTLKN